LWQNLCADFRFHAIKKEKAMNNTWQEKMRYRFDNFMVRGTASLIGGLGILSLVLIVVMAALVSLTGIHQPGEDSLNFWEAAWLSLMRTLDPGTMGGDAGWAFRLAMFIVTLGGVFIISTLIGVLTSGIDARMSDLRKGRSRVIESGHTVVLGWSSQIFTILTELISANENQKNACVVILGDKDKIEMEEEIKKVIGSSGKTRIVCRTGSSIDINDLAVVSLNSARSIIVLSPESENADAQTIKTILAITNNATRRAIPYHIVAEIKDARNIAVARMVGKDEVELIPTGDVISRIIAQTCRQSGLSMVYTELLSFGGAEIYFKDEPEVVGKSFQELLGAYKSSAVIGVCLRDGKPRLNPPMDSILQPGEQVIAVSVDDDTLLLEAPKSPVVQEATIVSKEQVPPVAERILILGWNWRAPMVIHELDCYVAPGSEILVIANDAGGESELARLYPTWQNLTVRYRLADTTDRMVLETVATADYNHVIVLACADCKTPQESDACTLITLLHLRDISEKCQKRFSIVSEMLDGHNRTLAEVTRADDFIVSEKLISLMMAQVSDNKALNLVFTEIFSPEGSEIYIKPAGQYVQLDVPINFYTVVESAARRAEVAFGYRLKAYASDAEKGYGIVINPEKSVMVTFSVEDHIVVLAEN
jgi:ion channel POLLUX/CASTOR